MSERAFTVTRREPHIFEAVNGQAVFVIHRIPTSREAWICTYGGVETSRRSHIKWANVPIAIRKAARRHFDSVLADAIAA